MNPTDYKAMLRAVESALEVCGQSSGFMDAMHRKLCEELRDACDRLVKIINATAPKEFGR